MATQRSGEKHSRRKEVPYSPTDSIFSSEGSARRGRLVDDGDTTNSSSSEFSDDSASSYEYKWEEAKPAKPPFQPFVTAVNIGTTELPALKREFCAVVPLKAVLVILFPNNTPGSLEEGIKKLDIHQLTKFEADLLTKYVQGLCDSGIHTFTVVDEIYVAEFCRGEVACSYESLQEKFTIIMKTLEDEGDASDEDRETCIQIYKAKKDFKSTSPDISNLFLPISKSETFDDGNDVEQLTSNIRKVVSGTGRAPKRVWAKESISKRFCADHVGDVIISRDRSSSSSNSSCGSSSNSESDELTSNVVDCSSRKMPPDSSKERNVAVVLKHLYPENEEDDCEAEKDVCQKSEGGKKASENLATDGAGSTSHNVINNSNARKDANKSSKSSTPTKNRVEHEPMDTWTNMVSMEILESKNEKSMKQKVSEKQAARYDAVDAKDNIIDETKAQSRRLGENDVSHSPRSVSTLASDVGVQSVMLSDNSYKRDVVPSVTQLCKIKSEYETEFLDLVVKLPNVAKGNKTGAETKRIVMKPKMNSVLGKANRHSGANNPICKKKAPHVADYEIPTSRGTSSFPTATKLLSSVVSVVDPCKVAASDLPLNESNFHGPNAEWKVTDSYSCESPERRVQVGKKKSLSLERHRDSKERGSRHKEARTSNGLHRIKDGRRRSTSPTRFRRREDERTRDRRASRSPVRKPVCDQDPDERRPWDNMIKGTSNSRNRVSYGHSRLNFANHSGSICGKGTPLRCWPVEEMYGGRGHRLGSYRPIQRTAKWVPDYSKLQFEYRPELYSSLSSDVDFGSGDYDDDRYYAQMSKHKVLRRRSARDETRNRSKLHEKNSSTTGSEKGFEKSAKVTRESGSRSVLKLLDRREARAGSLKSEVRSITVNAMESVIPDVGMPNKDVTNLFVSIRKQYEAGGNLGTYSSRAKYSLQNDSSRRYQRSESPTMHHFRQDEFRSPQLEKTKRRSHSPPCAKSFSPSSHRSGRNKRRRRSLSPISNCNTERRYTATDKALVERTFVDPNMRGSNSIIRVSAINNERFGFAAKAGNEYGSLQHSETRYSSAHSIRQAGLGDDSSCVSASATNEPMHSRFSLPLSASVQSSFSRLHCGRSLSQSSSAQQQNVKAEETWTAQEYGAAPCQFDVISRHRPPNTEDEQVIFLKGEPDLESPTEEWPFFSSGSDDLMSSVEDSCDGEVESLMFGKLAGLRKKAAKKRSLAEQNPVSESKSEPRSSHQSNAANAASATDSAALAQQLNTRKSGQNDVPVRLNTLDEGSNSASAGIATTPRNSSFNNYNGSCCSTDVDAKCRDKVDPVVFSSADGQEAQIIATVSQNRSLNVSKESSSDGVAVLKCMDKVDMTVRPMIVQQVVQEPQRQVATVDRKLKGNSADAVEIVASVDSPCAYEKVVMQESILKSDVTSDDVSKLEPNEAGNVVLHQLHVGSAESSEKSDSQEVHSSRCVAEVYLEAANVGVPVICDAEMQVLENPAVEDDGIALGATITVKVNQDAIDIMSGSSNAKSWKKKLLQKAQSDMPTSELSSCNKYVNAGQAKAEFAHIAVDFSEPCQDLNAKDIVNETCSSLPTTNAGEKSAVINTATKGNMDTNESASEPVTAQLQVGQAFKTNVTEEGRKTPEQTGNLKPGSSQDITVLSNQGEVTAQSCSEFSAQCALTIGDGKVDAKAKSSTRCVTKDAEDLLQIAGGGIQGTLVKGFAKEGSKLEQRSNSDSFGHTAKSKFLVCPVTSSCHVSATDISTALSEVTPKHVPISLQGIIATKEGPSTVPTGSTNMTSVLANSLIPHVTTKSSIVETSTTPSIIVSAITSSILASKSTNLPPASTADASMKDTTRLVSGVSASVSNADTITTVKSAESAKLKARQTSTSSSFRPLLSSVFANTEVKSRSLLSALPSFKITVPASPVTKTAVPTGPLDLSTSLVKGREETGISVPCTKVAEVAMSTKTIATASTPKRRILENSKLQQKKSQSSSRIFYNSAPSKTIVNDMALKEMKSSGTLASRSTFRGPQVNHKSTRKPDESQQTSAVTEQLLSNRPGFMSSRGPVSSIASVSLSQTSSIKLVSSSMKFSQAASRLSSVQGSAMHPGQSLPQHPVPKLCESKSHGLLNDFDFVETGSPTDPTQLSHYSKVAFQGKTQSSSTELVAPSTSHEKPLKSILRKPTDSFDKGSKHVDERRVFNLQTAAPVSKAGTVASKKKSTLVVKSPVKSRNIEISFDQRLHAGDDVIHNLLPLINSRGKPGPKKRLGPLSEVLSSGRKTAKQMRSSRNRGTKRNAGNGRGGSKRRKRLPSISSDEDIIEELNAGAGSLLPKPKSQTSESELSESEGEESDVDLVCFMNATEEGAKPSKVSKPECPPTDVKENTASKDKDENDATDLSQSIEDDSNEDFKAPIELVKRNNSPPSNSSLTASSPLPDDEISSSSEDDHDGNKNIFTKMTREIERESSEFAKLFDRSLVDLIDIDNNSCRKENMPPAGYSEPESTGNVDHSHQMEQSIEMNRNKPESKRAHPQKSPTSLSACSSSLIMAPIQSSPANSFRADANSLVFQPILPTPPTSPKREEDCNRKYETASGIQQSGPSQPGIANDAPIVGKGLDHLHCGANIGWTSLERSTGIATEEPSTSSNSEMTPVPVEPPAASAVPAEIQKSQSSYGGNDGIADLIAAAAEISGVTSQSGAVENVATSIDLADKPPQVVNPISLQTCDPSGGARPRGEGLKPASKDKTRTRRQRISFSERSVPDAESCHGFLEVSLSAPPNRTYALRRIPYVRVTTVGAAFAAVNSNSNSHGHPSALSRFDRDLQGQEPVLPTAAASSTYLRLRDLITLMKIHPECLFSLVSRCDATLYKPNEYTRRLFAVVYDPVCKTDANMADMTWGHARGESLQDFLEHMIVLENFLHTVLPKFYAEAMDVTPEDVPKFVNVKIFQPINDINEDVVKLFRKPYEYNTVFRNKEEIIKCQAMPKRKFSVSPVDNNRKRSRSDDSSGFIPRTHPTPRFAQQLPISVGLPRGYPRPVGSVSLEQHRRGLYLTSSTTQGLRTSGTPRMHSAEARQHQLSIIHPPRYGFGGQSQALRPLSDNQRMSFPTSAERSRNGFPAGSSYMSVHSAPRAWQQQSSVTSSQSGEAYSAYFAANMPCTNVIQHTGIPNRFSAPKSHSVLIPPQHVRNNTTLPIATPVNATCSQSTPFLIQSTMVGTATQEKVSDVSAGNMKGSTDVQEKEKHCSVLAGNGIEALALGGVDVSHRSLTTKEYLMSASNLMHPKDKEGETGLVQLLRSRNNLLKSVLLLETGGKNPDPKTKKETGMLDEASTSQSGAAPSGIDILAEAAETCAGLRRVHGDAREQLLSENSTLGSGPEFGHLSGVVGKLKSRVVAAETHGGKAKRCRKNSEPNRRNGRSVKPRGRAKK